MPKFRILWSLRGRDFVEAPSLLEAADVWLDGIRPEGVLPLIEGDCDGFEVDGVDEGEKFLEYNKLLSQLQELGREIGEEIGELK